MKYLTALFSVLAFVSCSHGDKKREDFPNETQKREKVSEERLIEKNINDTSTVDTVSRRQ